MDEFIDDPLLNERGNKNIAVLIRNNLNAILEEDQK